MRQKYNNSWNNQNNLCTFVGCNVQNNNYRLYFRLKMINDGNKKPYKCI